MCVGGVSPLSFPLSFTQTCLFGLPLFAPHIPLSCSHYKELQPGLWPRPLTLPVIRHLPGLFPPLGAQTAPCSLARHLLLPFLLCRCPPPPFTLPLYESEWSCVLLKGCCSHTAVGKHSLESPTTGPRNPPSHPPATPLAHGLIHQLCNGFKLMSK